MAYPSLNFKYILYQIQDPFFLLLVFHLVQIIAIANYVLVQITNNKIQHIRLTWFAGWRSFFDSHLLDLHGLLDGACSLMAIYLYSPYSKGRYLLNHLFLLALIIRFSFRRDAASSRTLSTSPKDGFSNPNGLE